MEKNNLVQYNPNFLSGISYHLQKEFLNNDLSIAKIERNQDKILKEVKNSRFFRLLKFVYEKDIKISYKLRSVFSALHSSNSPFIMKLISDGKSCEIYVGTKSGIGVHEKAKLLKGAIEGNFPGSSLSKEDSPSDTISNQRNIEIDERLFNNVQSVTSFVGIPSIKDKEEEEFIQGVENLILGMNGKPFSAIFIAEPITAETVEVTLDAYRKIYSVLSGQKEHSITDGSTSSKSTTKSYSKSKSIGESISKTKSESETNSNTVSINQNPWIGRSLINTIFGTDNSLKTDSPFLADIRDSLFKKKDRDNKSNGKNKSTTEGRTISSSHSTSTNTSTSSSTSSGETFGDSTSFSKQITYTNKNVEDFLEALDQQIKRLQNGKGIGFWDVGTYFLSKDIHNSAIAGHIYGGIVKGDESNFETSVVKTYSDSGMNSKKDKENILTFLKQYEIPKFHNQEGNLSNAINTNELTVQINFPHKSVPGLSVVETIPFGNNPPTQDGKTINIGKLYNYDQSYDIPIELDYNKFSSHIFVTGSTGSGKSNVTYNLIDKLIAKKINFLVIEPAKGEYKDEFGGRKDVSVYGTNSNYTELLRVNPFEFPKEIHIYEHIDRFIEILNACWPMEAAMPNILKDAMINAYISKGWIMDESICIGENEFDFPDFNDLLSSLKNVIEKSGFSNEVKSNYEGALVTRVNSLTNGINKLIFDKDNCIPDKELFDENVIVDLSRVASSESKALYMGILFMKLNEYRIANKAESNSELKHITILEEAHNLLKRTSSDQSQGSANLAGKSVEMISNAIAEMRTYGEGFIIADQSPGLLDMSVIRNTNTKICLRLPDLEDRKLVGGAMNLSDEQITELASLETGVASIYQNDWEEAVLCKFDKYISRNPSFKYSHHINELSDIDKTVKIIKNIMSNEYIPNKTQKNLINKTLPIEDFEINYDNSSNSIKNSIQKQLINKYNINEELVLKYVVLRLLDYNSNNENNKKQLEKVKSKI